MGRIRASDNARTRSKALQIEEISRGIDQFQDILGSIEDISREGFPYRDAARAKAELQLRECVRRVFGERSAEFQTYRHYRLRVSNAGETAQSIAAIKELMRILEDKKLELQGLKPGPNPESPPPCDPPRQPQFTLVPPGTPTAQIAMAPEPVTTTPPLTVSVAMTTNLGSPAAHPTPSHQLPLRTEPPRPAAQDGPQPSPVAQQPVAPVPPPPVQPVLSASRPQTPPPPPSTASSPSGVPAQPPRGRAREIARPPEELVPEPEQRSSRHENAPAASAPAVAPSAGMEHGHNPLELIRKVCVRFHAVARQLRLRKDYRATLDVEDDYDLQDLLCALLKVEFDEVGSDEWTPPYAGGAPRTGFLLHGDQIVVVAKKTRSGLTVKELADQVAADSSHYAARDNCRTLFCFIYDPEGRIGSPKRLEADLTSASDRYAVEVLVAPK
jgi:hypothetical protein